MEHQIKSLRTFIGSEQFDVSRKFYTELGFKECQISNTMSFFMIDNFGFYLQDYYVKDWVNNSMLFMEVDNADRYYKELVLLELHKKYENVRLIPVKSYDWGKECFLHDPSGVLWHFGQFY